MSRAWSVPSGRRIYAIGDRHGRDDLLAEIHRQIEADAQTAGNARCVVVYLGDYVDRGPSTREVIDRLIHRPLAGFERIHLIGNHEDMMLAFLGDPTDPLWLMNGGDAALRSYGIDGDSFYLDTYTLQTRHEELRDAIPEEHVAFLESLRILHVEGDYLFVHAGIRPGRGGVDRQVPQDLMWIRGPFLTSSEDYGKCVIHGHTIVDQPEVRSNRIAIDTGAVFSGHLTCLVLENDQRWFLST